MTHRSQFPFTTDHRSIAAEDDWRDQAVCRDDDPELHFPIGSAGPAVLQVEQAKANCRRCPVTLDCLQFALDHKIEFGVWGGLSEEERRSAKRRELQVVQS